MKKYHNYIIFEGNKFADIDIVKDLVKFAYMQGRGFVAACAISNVTHDPFPSLCEKCDRKEQVYIVECTEKTREFDFNGWQCGCFVDEDEKHWQYLAIDLKEVDTLNGDYYRLLNNRIWKVDDEIRAITTTTENGETIVVKTNGNGEVKKNFLDKMDEVSW